MPLLRDSCGGFARALISCIDVKTKGLLQGRMLSVHNPHATGGSQLVVRLALEIVLVGHVTSNMHTTPFQRLSCNHSWIPGWSVEVRRAFNRSIQLTDLLFKESSRQSCGPIAFCLRGSALLVQSPVRVLQVCALRERWTRFAALDVDLTSSFTSINTRVY